MVRPQARAPDAALGKAKAPGTVAAALQRHGIAGASVAPPGRRYPPAGALPAPRGQ